VVTPDRGKKVRAMKIFASYSYAVRTGLAVALLAATLNGCKSKQDAALEQAKKQAAATGQAQQIVSTDKDGNTVTTVVQPPAPGQKDEAVSTTVTPKPAAAAAPQSAAGGAPNPVPAPVPSAAPQVTPVPPPPPPQVHVTAGTTLAIRIDQRISVKDAEKGEAFTGEVVEPVTDGGGGAVIPKGSRVRGVVTNAEERGKFKGASSLSLRLTTLTLNGKEYPLETHAFREAKKGKGKRTGALIGGGAGLGLLIGGLAGGGKGAAIGGLAGAGAGTAGAGLTGNKDLVIQAETIVRFKLADELVLDPLDAQN
jgi:hypothetical protein